MHIIKKQVDFELSEITCKPGETFTVWLDCEKDKFRCKAEQVELRVNRDGKPEIFCNEEVEIKRFTDWEALR